MNILYAKVTGLNIYTVKKMATEAAEEVNCRCLLSFFGKDKLLPNAQFNGSIKLIFGY